jgi:hypothetical protein
MPVRLLLGGERALSRASPVITARFCNDEIRIRFDPANKPSLITKHTKGSRAKDGRMVISGPQREPATVA